MQTKRIIASLTAVIGVLTLLTAVAADAPSLANPKPAADSEPFPIEVTVTPSVVLISATQGKDAPADAANGLTIAGTTLPAGERTVSVTIKGDTKDSTSTQTIRPDAKGVYKIIRAAPAKPGTYEVIATAPDGRGVARAKFLAIDPPIVGQQLESAMEESTGWAEKALKEAEKQIEAQVESPPKAAARRKLADARKKIDELRNAEAGALRGTIGALSMNGGLMNEYRPRLAELTTALDATAKQTARVKELTATMSSADVGCHQLAFVTEAFRAIAAVLDLKRSFLKLAVNLAKDVVADAAGNRAKAAGSPAAGAFVSSQIVKNLPQLNKAASLAGNAYSIMADLGAFVSDTVFGVYCDQFSGPIEGIMNAQFFAGGNGPTMWWTYNYKITGRVTLYYPKSAKNSSTVRLNGRIEGYAHDFKTKEDALTVLFPKLMSGAKQYKKEYPPLDIGGSLASFATHGSGDTSAYAEGTAAGQLAPNSFLISVTGVLEKNSVTLLLGPAKIDISPVHRVTALILSPLTGGLGPQITWYSLPFGTVRKLLVNAASGESMKLTLTAPGDQMIAAGALSGQVKKEAAKGEYTVRIKACNPGC